MKPQICVFEITRHYISDNRHRLEPALYNRAMGALRARDFKALAGAGEWVDYAEHNVDIVRILRQISAFFRKNADFADDKECALAAQTSFERGERLCRITNRRLDYYFVNHDRLDPDVSKQIVRCQAYIRRALGSYRSFLDELPCLLKVTSGATALSTRSESLPFQKLVRKVACTPQCRPLFSAMATFLGYRKLRTTSVAWNRVEFVPKSWKTHRAIACEPAGNVPFQLAFDAWAKRGLARKGINLRSQENNQQHARIGSQYGGYATVDLSMASDTLSYNTVQWLLPQEWCEYLNRVRSPLFELNGEVRKYAKFSSMGNGATFALETLIFASMLHAIGSRYGIAYGDDLTVEPELYPALLRLLKFFGFVPNLEKSFTSGPFRESCGHDYYQGQMITPFYIRSTAGWNIPNTCHNVNGLAAISEHGALWTYLSKLVVAAKLPLVPCQDDTRSGVHVHPHFAYGRRLIRQHPEFRWTQQFLSFSDKSREVTCYDSRALALWFLHRGGASVDPVAGYDGYESSWYTTPLEKFKRKWTTWQMPRLGAPDHLFGWSGLLDSLTPV